VLGEDLRAYSCCVSILFFGAAFFWLVSIKLIALKTERQKDKVAGKGLRCGFMGLMKRNEPGKMLSRARKKIPCCPCGHIQVSESLVVSN